jgi:antitoxin component of RelBE/YafQ-DinJ toxin-antitoxin module
MAKRAMPGPDSLFRRKVRQPVSITLTRRHHQKLKAAQERLGLSRSDVLGLLVDLYADSVRIPHDLVVEDED